MDTPRIVWCCDVEVFLTDGGFAVVAGDNVIYDVSFCPFCGQRFALAGEGGK